MRAQTSSLQELLSVGGHLSGCSDLSLTRLCSLCLIFLFDQTTSPSAACLAVALRRTAPAELAAEVAAAVLAAAEAARLAVLAASSAARRDTARSSAPRVDRLEAEVAEAARAEDVEARWAAAVAASASSSRTLDLASSATLAASPTKQ